MIFSCQNDMNEFGTNKEESQQRLDESVIVDVPQYLLFQNTGAHNTNISFHREQGPQNFILSGSTNMQRTYIINSTPEYYYRNSLEGKMPQQQDSTTGKPRSVHFLAAETSSKEVVVGQHSSSPAAGQPPPQPALLLDVEDIEDLWYSEEDHLRQRQHIRAIAQTCRTHNYPFPRGLEVYGSDQRVRHRRMTLQCIRNASRNGLEAEQIAEISRRCSAWNAEIAVHQAIRDFASVYPIPEVVQNAIDSSTNYDKVAPRFPFAELVLQSKRGQSTPRNEETEEQGLPVARQVRQRVIAVDHEDEI